MRDPAPPAPAPPALAPPPGNPRFPLIDSLRAIAALSVLLSHTAFITSGTFVAWWGRYANRLDIGVCIFFLISGFLLYRPFVAARLAGRRPSRLRDYARRRLLRIVPAYWVVLTVAAIYPGLPGDVLGSDWWIYYGFLQVYSLKTVLNGVGPAWTLCVEMSFYALLPLYAWLVARTLGELARRVQVRVELIVLALAFAASLAYRVWLREAEPLSFQLNTLTTHMDWFAAGMAMAVVSAALAEGARAPRALEALARRPLACWIGAAVAFWAVSIHVGGPEPFTLSGNHGLAYTGWQDGWRHALFALTAALLLLPAVFGAERGGLPRRVLADRRLAWLGLISYGIYLWQMPLLVHLADRGAVGWFPSHPFIAFTLIGGAVTVAFAALSYYLVERPALRFKEVRTGRRRRRPGRG